VPNDALIFDAAGTRVAVLEPETKAGAGATDGQGSKGEDGTRGGERSVVRIRPVTIDRQTDATLELRAGLTGGEQVVVGPPASLRDGDLAVPRKGGKPQT
jgi:hypothetical protein